MIARFVSLFLLFATALSAHAQNLNPYLLAGTAQGTLAEVRAQTEKQLGEAGFEVLGRYTPADDESLGVVCVTHPLLTQNATEHGGLLGFASILRVGLHAEENNVNVSCMNPPYWGNAYYRADFPAVEEDYQKIDALLRKALGGLSEPSFEPFGSKKGLPVKRLRKYHYMMAMPYFDDVVVLDRGSSYEDAVARIESRAAEEDSTVKLVYSLKFPEQEMALYGTALGGERGEARFLPKIDFGVPRHVPFLPYELLVLKDRVISLHGKYRIALSFPDLSMGTFMKIVSTPGDIADAQRALVAP